MRAIDGLVHQLTRRQFGAVSRQQLLALGLGPSGVHRRVVSGELRTWASGVYVAAGAAARFELDVFCALLQRPSSVVSHAWAAQWWSLAGFGPSRRGTPVELSSTVHRSSAVGAALTQTRRLDPRDVVPMTDDVRQAMWLAARDRRRIARGGNHNHRTLWNPRPADPVDPSVAELALEPSVTSPERTIIDLARSLSYGGDTGLLQRVVDDALSRHIVTLSSMYDAVDRSYPERSSARSRAMRLLRLRAPGVFAPDSELERLALTAFAEWQLPTPERQCAIPGRERREGQLDFTFVEARVIVEVDGRRWHLSEEAFRADRRRDRDVQLGGWRIFRYTWEDFTVHRDRTRRELTRALGLPAARARAARRMFRVRA